MPAGSTIISTGIAGGPTVTGNTDRELAAPLLVCGSTAASTNQIVATRTSTAPRQRDRAPKRARHQSDPKLSVADDGLIGSLSQQQKSG
jgi:hypothetical protein